MHSSAKCNICMKSHNSSFKNATEKQRFGLKFISNNKQKYISVTAFLPTGATEDDYNENSSDQQVGKSQGVLLAVHQ